MAPVRFIVRPGQLREITTRLGGGSAKDVAEDVVLPEIIRYLSRPHPALNKFGWARKGFLNPPPGPVYKRTGDLIAGLKVVNRGRGYYAIDSTAIHRGYFYADVLQQRGYVFIPPSIASKIR
jgi:hypothetical protein